MTPTKPAPRGPTAVRQREHREITTVMAALREEAETVAAVVRGLREHETVPVEIVHGSTARIRMLRERLEQLAPHLDHGVAGDLAATGSAIEHALLGLRALGDRLDA